MNDCNYTVAGSNYDGGRCLEEHRVSTLTTPVFPLHEIQVNAN